MLVVVVLVLLFLYLWRRSVVKPVVTKPLPPVEVKPQPLPQPLPPVVTQPKSKWYYYPNVNMADYNFGVFGSDIPHKDRIASCEKTPTCLGFNTIGQLKNKLKPWDQWYPDKGTGMYILASRSEPVGPSDARIEEYY